MMMLLRARQRDFDSSHLIDPLNSKIEFNVVPPISNNSIDFRVSFVYALQNVGGPRALAAQISFAQFPLLLQFHSPCLLVVLQFAQYSVIVYSISRSYFPGLINNHCQMILQPVFVSVFIIFLLLSSWFISS